MATVIENLNDWWHVIAMLLGVLFVVIYAAMRSASSMWLTGALVLLFVGAVGYLWIGPASTLYTPAAQAIWVSFIGICLVIAAYYAHGARKLKGGIGSGSTSISYAAILGFIGLGLMALGMYMSATGLRIVAA